MDKAPFYSFTQSVEDVILWRALSETADGFYIDMGAHHPLIDSTQQFQTDQGNIADVSYPQVITQFQESSTALQAAQKAFVQVQGLSLFNYIS